LDSPYGAIYDWDYPRIYKTDSPAGEINRARFNFKAFATVTVDGGLVRVSPIVEYYVRLSTQQTTAPNGTDWVLINDVPGDNSAGSGTTSLTWDLQ
jgi:hypothetical protein